jgi:hypothetical protein
MTAFDIQGIELRIPADQAFAFIADPSRLPQWAQAFATVRADRALMRTPQGEVDVGLQVHAAAQQGTIDWTMTFPDGSVAKACSRVVESGPRSCVFSFILLPPPVPLEQLEGALAQQSRTLAQELRALKRILEDGR